MTSINTTNYNFLKNFRPELYKLAIKMEDDLLIAPISILAYSTRFLEYILHDIVKEYNYDINKKAGYVEKINEVLRFGYEYTDFAQLLIDAYIARNNSIHNYDISKSLKEDKRIAFELNETLFHIADVYYRNITKDNEMHIYAVPKLISESQKRTIKQGSNANHYLKPKSDKNSQKFKDNVKKDKDTVTENKLIIEPQSNFSNVEKQHSIKNPYGQSLESIDESAINEFVKFLEEGYSQQSALKHVDINQKILNDWYINKKSEFLDGYKDSLFVKYNELLIENSIKSIIENKGLGNNGPKVEFWMQYFEEFIDESSQNLTEDQLKAFRLVFKKNTTKKDKPANDKKQSNQNISVKSNISKEELEKRQNLMLEYIDKVNFKLALKKSKLGLYEFQKSKKEFLNGKRNNFYHKLSQKLMNRYLAFRNKGKSTDDFCRMFAIDKFEVDLWITNDLFKDFQIRYNNTRMNLFKKAAKDNKTQNAILNDLEMNVNQFNRLIQLVNNDAEYIRYRHIIKQYYAPYSLEFFIDEFRKNLDIDVALKNSNLTKNDLNVYLSSNKEVYDEFIEIQIDKIVNILIKQGKIDDNQLNKLGMTNEDYSKFEEEIKQRVFDKQIKEITNSLSDGMLLVTASNVGCDIDTVFDWILKGSVGSNQFTNFANKYWETHIDYINSLNSNDGTNLKMSQNNLEIFGLKNHRAYWKKWGLIDKNNSYLTIEDIKTILKEVIK